MYNYKMLCFILSIPDNIDLTKLSYGRASIMNAIIRDYWQYGPFNMNWASGQMENIESYISRVSLNGQGIYPECHIYQILQNSIYKWTGHLSRKGRNTLNNDKNIHKQVPC